MDTPICFVSQSMVKRVNDADIAMISPTIDRARDEVKSPPRYRNEIPTAF